MFFNINCQ